jgi:tRNA (cytidine/uridine-2'-O-)-methyltransferase
VSTLDVRPHRLAVALLHPQIAPNTGNVARTCVASGCELHLVRPLGFVLSDRELRRSAMDYWDRLRLTIHDDDAAFFCAMTTRRIWLFDSSAKRILWDADFRDGDMLVFGSESKGIDQTILRAHAAQALRIPQVRQERCLNLSTSVGIAVYEAIRRLHSDQNRPDAPSFVG